MPEQITDTIRAREFLLIHHYFVSPPVSGTPHTQMDSPVRTWTRRVVRDGLLLSVVFSAIIVGTALIDPWIMLENYPPAIRESVTPPDDLPMVIPVFIGVGMIVVLVWLMVRSVIALERERGTHLGFGGAALHAWLLFQFVNLWDVVIIDWLLVVTIQPAAFILPGTEGHPAYDDYLFHLKESYAHPVPWIGGLVGSLVIAGIATLVIRRRRRAQASITRAEAVIR